MWKHTHPTSSKLTLTSRRVWFLEKNVLQFANSNEIYVPAGTEPGYDVGKVCESYSSFGCCADSEDVRLETSLSLK